LTSNVISHRLNAERVVLLSWSRAILLQLAHPLVAAGVADHSTFRDGPIVAARRLHHTVQAMLALTFGDAAAQASALDGIRRIHTRVHGHLREGVGLFPAGTRYSAEDPHLVRWVHLTLIDSVVLAYEALIAPLSSSQRDTYCDEAAAVAIALGARETEIPRTWHDVRCAMDDALASGELRVGPDALALAEAVLAPPVAVLTAPLASLNRLVTAGWLPPGLRAQYGFPWSEARARRFDRSVRLVRLVRHALPASVAQWRVSFGRQSAQHRHE
jgi:uncharacterized protein (DUF2236 family)